jgi:xylulokinase
MGRRPEVAKILVIDLGTTYFKFALFDRAGQLCGVTHLAPPIRRPEAEWMELDAGDFARAVAEGVARLGARTGGLADVEAVGFATQTNSFLLLDAEDRPLTPIILWPDRRAADLEAEYRRRCDVPGFAATTGIPQLGCQFMPAKLLWLREHCPAACRRMSTLCLISDYLTWLLTGRRTTEAGVAALTGLVDVRRCQWWPELLGRFDLDAARLPPVVRAGTDLGPLDARAAGRLGLPPECHFVVGCLDQYAGAIGAGNVEPGAISETTGTVLATVRCADRLAADLGPAVFQGPAFREGLYWQMAFGDVSAGYLHWYRDQLPDRPDFDQLTASAARIEPGAEGLRLRTGAALTTPEEVFEGLSPRHTPAHAVRCILEAVAAALGEQVAALSPGAPPQEIRCAGGAARSDLWLAIKADVVGACTVATLCPEPTSLGAALLAEAALRGADLRPIARQWICLKPPHRPDPARQKRYRELREEGSGGRSQK